MNDNGRWYVARYRSALPWRRWVVVRWNAARGQLDFLDRHGGQEFRGFWLRLEAAETMADFANWRDDFHEREVRYDPH